ncbi:glycine zipper family protein [Hippea alviniae]|uniref:glycine zipper family protein n=1 Tax=Hippea alviniae TaxID=1279027 RepID=UPI0003B344F5|nr:glycine zipper family protein [Hippea alviniae]
MDRLKVLVVGLILTVFLGFSVTSCTTESENVALGTAVGAGIGAAVTKNKWKGVVIGGILGAVAGEAMYQIQQRAINEAVAQQKPVAYQRTTPNGGWERVEAEPVGQPTVNPNEHTKCQKVHVREIRNGKVIKDEIKEVCKGYKETNTY